MASTRVRLNNPELLRWARESAGLSVDDIGRAVSQRPETVTLWETGAAQPTYSQLHDFADKVKRPLSTLFLPEVPPDTPLPRDFRRRTGDEGASYSPELRLWARRMHNRLRDLRSLFVELGHGTNLALPGWQSPAEPGELAAELRRLLGVSLADQMACRDGYAALRLWRTALFCQGVVVQLAPLPTTDARGFSVIAHDLGGVCLSSKDAPYARIFSLFHEVTHLCLREPGVSGEPVIMAKASDPDARIEQFCDRVAAAFLLPSSESRVRAAVRELGRQFSRETATRLARELGVSKYVLARRALDDGAVDDALYREEIDSWWTDDRQVSRGGRPNYYQTQASQIGSDYLAVVFEAVDRAAVSASEAAHMVEMKLRTFEKARLQPSMY